MPDIRRGFDDFITVSLGDTETTVFIPPRGGTPPAISKFFRVSHPIEILGRLEQMNNYTVIGSLQLTPGAVNYKTANKQTVSGSVAITPVALNVNTAAQSAVNSTVSGSMELVATGVTVQVSITYEATGSVNLVEGSITANTGTQGVLETVTGSVNLLGVALSTQIAQTFTVVDSVEISGNVNVSGITAEDVFVLELVSQSGDTFELEEVEVL